MAGNGQNNFIESKENFIKRFSSLLAVSSTCDIFYNVYHNTKDKYPAIAWVWEVSEGGITRTTALALKTMQPVLQKLQPQIAVANDYACKGLDHLEEKFPVLHEDSTKIACDVKEMAVRKMKSVRDKVTSPILHVSDKAINVVTCSLEKTKVFVHEGVTSVLSSGIGRSLTNGVHATLLRSEKMVDSHLLNEGESETVNEDLPSKEATSSSKLPEGNSTRMYFLSSKLYNHMYKHVVMFIQNAEKHKPHISLMATSAKENVDVASSESKVQDPVGRLALCCSTSNKEGEQKESGIVAPAVPGLKNFQSVFSSIVTSLNEMLKAVQMMKQQILKTVQRFYTQVCPSDLAISLEHFIPEIKGKLQEVWEALSARKDNALSHLISFVLLPGMSPKENELKSETQESKLQGWRSLVPRWPKEEKMLQISEGKPESQSTQGREVESTPNENVAFTAVAEGGTSALLSSEQSEKGDKRPEPEIPGEQLQKDLEQHIAQTPTFLEQQATGEDFQGSEAGCPNPF